ncbi:tyrosine-type recombinase/integrase [Alienimonas chondri]|uniref:tyrosine-type recombinase/integrase n=1 Tax=Alienimonas chondri TaxID=2681879 RepID=UPI001489898B|nr:site-specific integrase [Alienimonas chondri]
MASVSTDPHGTRRVQFTGPDGKRRTVRLGKLSKRGAEEIAGLVERLTAAALAGHAPPDADSRRIAGLPDATHAKLAAVGLVTARASNDLGEFLAAYLRTRETDGTKPGTIDHLRRSANDLLGYFGTDRRLRDLTRGDADDFRRHLSGRLGENTVRRRIGRAKQFMTAALRKELIERNPFEGQACQVRGNPDRAYYLTTGDALRVLDACPETQWRLIFSLARWGGLRCPSELVPLTWDDVDWERNRLTVTSPKTAHHEGGGSRTIPLFPELRPHLEAAREEADPRVPHIVTRCRDSRVNLRQQFQRIVKQSGVKPWPKLFQNLRATRQTELAGKFPVHVVCEWFGNSGPVAAEHYLQVTDADYDRASAGSGDASYFPGKSDAESDAAPTQNPTLPASDKSGQERTETPQTLQGQEIWPAQSAAGRSSPTKIAPRVGLEPTT